MSLFLLGITTIISLGSAQLIGDYQAEVHPPFSYEVCNESQCESVDAEIVLDAEWRWLHFAGNVNNCFEGGFGQGGDWVDACREAPSSGNEYCTTRCAIDGADYKGTYGIKTDGHTISMEYRTPQAFSTNLNSRVFLLEGVDRYQTFTLMNNELSFDVDVSDVPCGLNAALKLVQMDADGGQGRFENMKAGAKYGSGYCDAWCRRELRWPGEANVEGWIPSATDPFGGRGSLGACCSEMSLWNSNRVSYNMDSRPCKKDEYHVCTPDECDPSKTFAGEDSKRICAQSGCDHNPYRLQNTEFYGPNKTVDTTKPFTVVTQFEEAQITRFFVQNGKKILPPAPHVDGIPDAGGGINKDYCESLSSVFDDYASPWFDRMGGYERHNEMLRQPMVLALSITDDHWTRNLDLDGIYPLDREGMPGAARGPCSAQESDPLVIGGLYRETRVVWSNVRFGSIGSTVYVS